MVGVLEHVEEHHDVRTLVDLPRLLEVGSCTSDNPCARQWRIASGITSSPVTR